MIDSTLRDIRINRVFEAPRSLVYANWTEAEHLAAWFAPAGFSVIDCSIDKRTGGIWRVVYHSTTNGQCTEHGHFINVAEPEHLHFTLSIEDGHGDLVLRSEVKVFFLEDGGRTKMTFIQSGITSDEMRSSVENGWGTCFDKLDGQLTTDREIRALFDDWFRASMRKDLDASMEPIAVNVHSYEHEAPLSYHGVKALRATCKAGFEHMPDNFRWDVPDLKIIVRGDIAVTWGLNHMYGSDVEMWSRGTRILQKIDGHWKMIHQHVSFPYDPASGAAMLNLAP